MTPARTGFGLLEVIAAVVILSVSGIAAISMTAESVEAVRRSRDTERRIFAANAFLETVALWSRDDFDRRLGERPQGPWLMYTERTQPTLYRVALSDTIDGAIVLETVFYRRELRK